jgi:hypothetical protein
MNFVAVAAVWALLHFAVVADKVMRWFCASTEIK